MVVYIDKEGADQLEAGWSGSSTQEEIDRALFQSNTWLNAAQLVEFESEIPLQIKYAAVELAKLSLAGELYKSVEKVSSKTVSASGVSVSKSYEQGFKNESRDMNYIRALVQPYVTNSAHFYIYRG